MDSFNISESRQGDYALVLTQTDLSAVQMLPLITMAHLRGSNVLLRNIHPATYYVLDFTIAADRIYELLSRLEDGWYRLGNLIVSPVPSRLDFDQVTGAITDALSE